MGTYICHDTWHIIICANGRGCKWCSWGKCKMAETLYILYWDISDVMQKFLSVSVLAKGDVLYKCGLQMCYV